MALPQSYADFDLPDYENLWRSLRPTLFDRRMCYSERICLERWVSECEPRLVYGGRNCALLGLALAGDPIGGPVVHAPPTDRFYLDSSTGYPPDWDFYKGKRVKPQTRPTQTKAGEEL